jgi:Smg protein
MFDILVYLFENYIHNESDIYVNHADLTKELSRAGFHDDDIFKALKWLDNLSALQESHVKPYLSKGTSNATRIYCAAELAKMDVECQGFLLFLEQVNVLDAVTREMVIDRVMDLDTNSISLEDLKWVVLMVLFNVPGHENAYAQMEDLIFDEPEGPLH